MKDSQPIVITLLANLSNNQLCPVQALELYTTQFQYTFGPLFTHSSPSDMAP